MADDDRTDEQPPGDRVPADERPGGAGSGTAGGVLESPGTRPASEGGEDEEEKTLAQELVEEAPGVEEVSPDMGTTRADPGAGGARFDELVAKRRSEGLSDHEADELGRLMAEREGREWTSSRSLKEGFPADSA